MVRISGKTHVGRRRVNEDRIVADSKWGLAIVADGMGGPGSGDIASQIVVSTLTDALGNEDTTLDAAINAAHQAVLQAADAGTGNKGMGSTVVAARFRGNDYEIGWIGDSRAYLFDGDALTQLTRDHSQVERLLSQGEITPDEAEDYPGKNVITRAMGIAWAAGEHVPVVHGSLGADQHLLLCSDGLNDAAGDRRTLEILRDGKDVLQQLVDAALQAGGSDNISVVLCTAEHGASGQSPPAVAVTRSDGQRQYFPAAESDVAPAAEIETTRIQTIQPGTVSAKTPAAGTGTGTGTGSVAPASTSYRKRWLWLAAAAAVAALLMFYILN